MTKRLNAIPRHAWIRLTLLALLPHAAGIGLLLLIHEFGPDLGQSLVAGMVAIGLCAVLSMFLMAMLELRFGPTQWKRPCKK